MYFVFYGCKMRVKILLFTILTDPETPPDVHSSPSPSEGRKKGRRVYSAAGLAYTKLLREKRATRWDSDDDSDPPPAPSTPPPETDPKTTEPCGHVLGGCFTYIHICIFMYLYICEIILRSYFTATIIISHNTRNT